MLPFRRPRLRLALDRAFDREVRKVKALLAEPFMLKEAR